MFSLKQSSDYVWPVKFTAPADNGTSTRHSFKATFKRLTQSEIKELGESNKNDAEMVREILVGFSELQDEDGNNLEFSDKNLDRLLDVAGMASIILSTYLESLSGSLRKN